MRVAAYVRVSTSLQVKLQTIEQQLEMVRQYVKEKGWELPGENIFRDDGYSGAALKRPALDALRDKKDARAGVGRGRCGLSGPSGAQLRSSDGLDRGAGEAGLPAGVRREADEYGSQRPAPVADPWSSGRV